MMSAGGQVHMGEGTMVSSETERQWVICLQKGRDKNIQPYGPIMISVVRASSLKSALLDDLSSLWINHCSKLFPYAIAPLLLLVYLG